MERKVAAIVVTYNRQALLKQCIQHLLAQTVACTVLLVDNASTDGTAEWAQAFCAKNSRVRYRNTGSNGRRGWIQLWNGLGLFGRF